MSRPAAITTLAALATSAVFVTWFVSCYLLIYVLLLSFGEGLLRQLAVGMFLASPVFVIWLVYAVIRYGRMRTRAADQQRGKDHNQDAQKSRIKLHTHRILQRFMVGNAILGSITDQPGKPAGFFHHMVTGINTRGTADALHLRAVADIDPGGTYLYTLKAVETITQPAVLLAAEWFSSRAILSEGQGSLQWPQIRAVLVFSIPQANPVPKGRYDRSQGKY